MEKLAKKLANNISSSLGYDNEREAVIAYGLIAIIQICITVLLVLFLGILVGVPAEAMIVCFSASILRKYSGGAHASTAELCTLISVTYCILAGLLSKLCMPVYSPLHMLILLITVFGLSFYVIYIFAPVDSVNKPIKTDKKKTMKKVSFIILSIYLAVSVIFFILSFKFDVFKSYGTGMLLGISWQGFTLTPFGAMFIGKINNTLHFRKEGHK